MNAETSHLFEHLHRGGTACYWWTVSRDKLKTSHWWRVGNPSPLPGGNMDVYFNVHPAAKLPERFEDGRMVPPEHCRAQIADIAAINCLFAEFDSKDFGGDKAATLAHIKHLPVCPSVIVDSGGGYHSYWLLRDPFPLDGKEERERASRAQHAWVSYVGGDGGARDLARVLRVPETCNFKYDPPRPVGILLADFERIFDLPELETLVQPAGGIGSEKAKPLATAISEVIPQSSRNSSLTSLGGSMRRRGATRESIEAALLIENRARCQPPLDDEEVRRIAASVSRYTPNDRNQPAEDHLEPSSIPNDRQPVLLSQVIGAARRHLYLPDAGPIEIALAVVAANHLPGDPVWLLQISPPGRGKTEAINILQKLPHVWNVGVLTEASLLSGTPKKNAGNAKGGLLREIGDFGILLVKDFGGILSLTREARGPILAAMREIYDGSWTRVVGSDGGRVLTWTGKVGLIGGATPSIDQHYAIMAFPQKGQNTAFQSPFMKLNSLATGAKISFCSTANHGNARRALRLLQVARR